MKRTLWTSVLVGALAAASPFLVSARQRNPDEIREVRMPALIISDFVGTPESLAKLAEPSSLIVDATVETVYPARWSEPGARGSLETDSLFRVRRVIKGKESSALIALSQPGGVTPSYTARGSGEELYQEGQRYILFLVATEARRLQGLPNRNDAPWYDQLFSYASVVRVQANQVHLSSRLPFQRAYEGRNVAEFLKELEEHVAAKK